MATKTKKVKEEIIDLAKPKIITEKELSSLQSTIRTMDKLTDDVGRLEIQKYSLLKAMDGVQRQIQDLRKSFQEKYNTDNINIQTGEISYPEETTEDGEVNS
tara:strand:+ start:264 stop:569 length:306 start_codon:yes stop_codon:yes gene_type:complete